MTSSVRGIARVSPASAGEHGAPGVTGAVRSRARCEACGEQFAVRDGLCVECFVESVDAMERDADELSGPLHESECWK